MAVCVWEGFYFKAEGFADEAEGHHGAVNAGYDVWVHVHGRFCDAVHGVVWTAEGHDDGFVVVFDGDFVGFVVPFGGGVKGVADCTEWYEGAVLIRDWANIHGFGGAVDVHDLGAKGQGNGTFFRCYLIAKGEGIAEDAVFVAAVVTKGEFDFTGTRFVTFHIAAHGAVGGKAGEACCGVEKVKLSGAVACIHEAEVYFAWLEIKLGRGATCVQEGEGNVGFGAYFCIGGAEFNFVVGEFFGNGKEHAVALGIGAVFCGDDEVTPIGSVVFDGEFRFVGVLFAAYAAAVAVNVGGFVGDVVTFAFFVDVVEGTGDGFTAVDFVAVENEFEFRDFAVLWCKGEGLGKFADFLAAAVEAYAHAGGVAVKVHVDWCFLGAHVVAVNFIAKVVSIEGMGYFVAHNFAGAVETFDTDVVVTVWVVVGVKFDVNFTVIGATAVLQREDHFFSGGGSVFLIEGFGEKNFVTVCIVDGNNHFVVSVWVVDVRNGRFFEIKIIGAVVF